MLPVAAKRERRCMAKPSASEEDKENINGGRGGLSDVPQGSRLLLSSSSSPGSSSACRHLPLSDSEDYTGVDLHPQHRRGGRHHSPQPFLPEILNNNKYGIVDKVQRSSSPQLTHFLTYASGHGGSVEHWKKLARKAELEMHLEQEQHKSDREKDLDSIHRLRCRTSALEAAAQDRDAVIEKQRRKINFLKSQLGGVNKRFGKELSFLRNQSEQMQVKITSVAGVNEKKILDLRENLQLSESKRKLLEHQLALIYKCIEDPLEMFNLTELQEGAPEPVRQGSIVKSSKKVWKKPGFTDLNDGYGQKFDDSTMPKEDQQGEKDAFSVCSVTKRRLGRSNMAGKILYLRSENNLLSKQVGQRDEKLKSLFHDSELLRKQLKEAITSRNSAISQVKETERLFVKLEAIESLIVKAGIISDQDLNTINESRVDVSLPKGVCKSADNELKQNLTDEIDSEVATVVTDETKVNPGKISHKQAFRKWGTILNKMRSALMVFVSKVHATSQLESNLRLERESLNVFAHKLKYEVLVELDPQNPDAMEEMEKSKDQLQKDMGKRRDLSNLTIDRELFHKILLAVREQKRKYLATAGRVEDLKKEKFAAEANLFSRQKKITEQEKKLAMLGSEQEILHCYITCMHKMLASVDQDNILASSILELKSNHKNMMVAKTLEKRCKIETLLRKVQYISKERDQLKAVIAHLQEENQGMCGRLMTLQDSIKCLDVAVDNSVSGNGNLLSHLKQIKVRKDELESFYEEAFSYHNAITTNLQMLEGIIAEGEYHKNDKLCKIGHIVNKPRRKSLMQEHFVDTVSRLPDLIFKINCLSSGYKEFESKLQNVELKKKHAEDKVLEMEMLECSWATSKKELEALRGTLKNIHHSLTADNMNVLEPELLSSTIVELIQKLKADAQENTRANADSKQKIEEMKNIMLCSQDALVDVLKNALHLKKDIAEEIKRNEDHGNLHEFSKCSDYIHIEMRVPGMALSEVVSSMGTCLEEIQHLRNLEKMCTSTAVSKLKQELEEELSRHSENTSNHWNEKLRLLSEEITQIQAEKETLAVELAASSKLVNDLQITLQGLQEERSTKVGEVEKERDNLKQLKEVLTVEIQSLKLQNQQQSENSKKQVEALEKKLLNIKEEHSGSVGSVEELKQVIQDERSQHEQTLEEWKGKVSKLEEEKDSLGFDIQSLNARLKEKDMMAGNLTKEIESLKHEMESVTSGSSDEVLYLQTIIKEKDQAETKLKSQYMEKVDSLEKEISGLQHEKVVFMNDLEKLQKTADEYDIRCKKKLKELELEVLRLGGADVNDETHKSRHQVASEKLRDFFGRGSSQEPQFSKMAHKLLEVSGTSGGLSQAAIHYFSFNQKLDDITFENGNLLGSQSSNMLAELVLLSPDSGPIYETKTGDVLGLSVKVKGLNDRTTREILYNTNVIRTDEIMEAIKDQPIDNFSLWPDLVSSWKWERSSNKGWILVCIKWRFLFKNIFPEVSEALQVLSIKQGG